MWEAVGIEISLLQMKEFLLGGLLMNIRMTLSAVLVFGALSALGGCSSSHDGTVDANANDAAGSLRRYLTCGDPVCRGYTAGSGAALCTTEKAGDSCSVEGQQCDPKNDCNALLVCASSDPTMRPGGCPISRARYKRDIHYLEPADLARYRDELLGMKLATWRYKHDPAKQRLGFLIDDNEGSVAVDGQRDLVDLYGYTSLAVATIQLQARQIAALESELAALKKGLARVSTPKNPRIKP